MYKMQNGVVYGPLSKITKLAAMPALTNNTKESKVASGIMEGKKPDTQKGLNNKLSAAKTPAAQAPATQATVTSDPLTVPMNQQGSQEAGDHLQRQLRDAILLSEILGKPVCRKRKRSYYGD